VLRRLSLGLVVGALAALAPASAYAQAMVHPSEYAQSSEILWGCNDTYLVVGIYAASLDATANEQVMHYINCDSKVSANQLLYELYDRGVDMHRAKVFVTALDTVWMRDYGPLVVKKDGKKTVVDVNYYPGRWSDDTFPRRYAGWRGYGYVRADLDYEGGNFMTDGKGTAFTSKSVYGFNNDKTASQVNGIFKNQLGCSTVQTMEYLLNDGTTHIDMYAKLLSPTTVLVSRAVSTQSQNHALLERNAQKFASLGYKVVRATMANDDLSTYTNSLIVGRTALIPIYKTSRDAAALQVYRDAGYTAVGIDCRTIIKYGGAIHCISMQVAR
jgi:agmatine deiminase